MPLSYFELTEKFRYEAIFKGLCLGDLPRDSGRIVYFCLSFNAGDLFCVNDPEIMYKLATFAREHATAHSGDFIHIRHAYGLLRKVTSTEKLNLVEESESVRQIIWETYRYDKSDPTHISLEEWLEMMGYPMPLYVYNNMA